MKLSEIRELAEKVNDNHVDCGDKTIISLAKACLKLCYLFEVVDGMMEFTHSVTKHQWDEGKHKLDLEIE